MAVSSRSRKSTEAAAPIADALWRKTLSTGIFRPEPDGSGSARRSGHKMFPLQPKSLCDTQDYPSQNASVTI